MNGDKIRSTRNLLRIVFGLVPIVAGLDKFTHLLTDWTQYLHPAIARMIAPSLFMEIVGVIEIAAGVLVLSKLARIGAYVVSAWLVGIALNLIFAGHFFDVAVRDLVMAIGAFALAQLIEATAEEPSASRVSTGARTVSAT